VDVKTDVIEQLNRGEPNIYEKGLSELLRSAIRAGRFRATVDLGQALPGADIVLIAVGTPSDRGRIDLRYVEDASREIGRAMKIQRELMSVVVKSTVVPGTTDTIVRRILEAESNLRLGEFGLGMNPEFLREGDAVRDFMEPDRIVLGYEDPATLRRLEALYAPWSCEKIAVSSRTAEFIKYANNCLLATQISAVNELANLAAELGGVDIMDVMRGVHADKRWSPVEADGRRVRPKILDYLAPGCGFGGSCLPKDVQALRTLGADHAQPMRLLQAVLDINEAQPREIMRLLHRYLPDLHDRRVLLLGLAFKPGTDDVRESASGQIIADLAAAGAVLVAHDPVATDNARRAWPALPVSYVANWVVEVPRSDAVIVATKWPDYAALRGVPMMGKVIVDARRMFLPEDFPGARYLTIGRG
jgi:UDPglucose 6-dehydrogenase/GDP-mannose 6-dehydrogenase